MSTERVQRAIRRGLAQGFVIGSTVEQAPHLVFAPSIGYCHLLGIRERRIRESAIDHGQLAIEAALTRLAHRGELDALAAIRSEADLTSDAWRKTYRSGSRLVPRSCTADVEVVTTAGRRYWTEVLSRSYRNEDIEAKYRGLDVPVDIIATSRTIAARAARAMPHATCFHF